eukprot:scaffold65570_cov73-Phaeocystis_antarctica.AAC.2
MLHHGLELRSKSTERLVLISGRQRRGGSVGASTCWPRHSLGADALHHAEGDEPLEQKGALHLGEPRLLLVRARVGLERAVVRGRVIEHRSSIWLVGEGVWLPRICTQRWAARLARRRCMAGMPACLYGELWVALEAGGGGQKRASFQKRASWSKASVGCCRMGC